MKVSVEKWTRQLSAGFCFRKFQSRQQSQWYFEQWSLQALIRIKEKKSISHTDHLNPRQPFKVFDRSLSRLCGERQLQNRAQQNPELGPDFFCSMLLYNDATITIMTHQLLDMHGSLESSYTPAKRSDSPKSKLFFLLLWDVWSSIILHKNGHPWEKKVRNLFLCVSLYPHLFPGQAGQGEVNFDLFSPQKITHFEIDAAAAAAYGNSSANLQGKFSKHSPKEQRSRFGTDYPIRYALTLPLAAASYHLRSNFFWPIPDRETESSFPYLTHAGMNVIIMSICLHASADFSGRMRVVQCKYIGRENIRGLMKCRLTL